MLFLPRRRSEQKSISPMPGSHHAAPSAPRLSGLRIKAPIVLMLIAQPGIESLALLSSNQAEVGATMFRSEGDLDDEAGAFDGADGAFSVRRSGVQEGKQGSTQITRSKGTDYTESKLKCFARVWTMTLRAAPKISYPCNPCPYSV